MEEEWDDDEFELVSQDEATNEIDFGDNTYMQELKQVFTFGNIFWACIIMFKCDNHPCTLCSLHYTLSSSILFFNSRLLSQMFR